MCSVNEYLYKPGEEANLASLTSGSTKNDLAVHFMALFKSDAIDWSVVTAAVAKMKVPEPDKKANALLKIYAQRLAYIETTRWSIKETLRHFRRILQFNASFRPTAQDMHDVYPESDQRSIAGVGHYFCDEKFVDSHRKKVRTFIMSHFQETEVLNVLFDEEVFQLHSMLSHMMEAGDVVMAAYESELGDSSVPFSPCVPWPSRYRLRVWCQPNADDPSNPSDGKQLFNYLYRKCASTLTSYGATHVGLQIGQFMLHWTENSVFQARLMSGNGHAKTTLLVDPVWDLKDAVSPTPKPNRMTYDELKKIATVLVDWNKTRSWAGLTSNCHHGLNAVLDSLHIGHNWYQLAGGESIYGKIVSNIFTGSAKRTIASPSKEVFDCGSQTELQRAIDHFIEQASSIATQWSPQGKKQWNAFAKAIKMFILIKQLAANFSSPELNDQFKLWNASIDGHMIF